MLNIALATASIIEATKLNALIGNQERTSLFKKVAKTFTIVIRKVITTYPPTRSRNIFHTNFRLLNQSNDGKITWIKKNSTPKLSRNKTITTAIK
jgi:hypothetical protein